MLATTPAGKRVFVEVKVGPEILPELDRVLKASKLKPEQTPIISFHAPVIAAVKKARPDLAAYWIVNIKPAKGKTPPTVDALIAQAKAIHADGLDLSATPALDQAYADKVKKAGLKLYVWTVNDEAEARRMAAIGVDGITTDRPGWLRELLGTVQSTPFRDLDGRTHTPLAQPAAKATVLFFILPDCPISNAYAPEIKRICKDYEAKQVASFVVHADPDVTAEQARKHAKEYGIACPVLRDPTHILVKHTGATIAPEVAVLSADGKLLYRGRIDDWYVDVGKRRAEPTQRDLRLALDAIVQGKTPPTQVTKAIGCYLPEPKK
jgi:thiol-disulfide isomerase/thioredoxin